MPDNSSPGNRMTQADADMLGYLRYHWGKAYEIAASDKGWTATRRDDGSAVNCKTGRDLLVEIQQDYIARPVSRWLP